MAEAVEAFLDTEGLGALGPVSYRAGYRYADTEHVICSIALAALPAEPHLELVIGNRSMRSPQLQAGMRYRNFHPDTDVVSKSRQAFSYERATSCEAQR
jgi:hypothetical protein